MESTKEAFIRLALDCNVLRFGEFQLKSGRKSPYFFNAGLFYQGKALRQIGRLYANILIQQKVHFNHLFGPAYKGLPLATATAIALAEQGVETTVTFNRKEKKTHGEEGLLMGAPLSGQTVIIDDVITAGTAFREAQQLITEQGATLSAVVIALDRCERGLTHRSTLSEIQDEGISVFSIITLFDLIEYLSQLGKLEQVKQLNNYHEAFGA